MLDPVVNALVVPERRRRDRRLLCAMVPFDDVECLFVRLSFAEEAEFRDVCSSCGCCFTVQAKARSFVLQDSGMIWRRQNSVYAGAEDVGARE